MTKKSQRTGTPKKRKRDAPGGKSRQNLPLAAQSKSKPSDKFRQLEEILPTPNEYRTASGAPGNRYWQQRADYSIEVELDDAQQRITGRGPSPTTITLQTRSTTCGCN